MYRFKKNPPLVCDKVLQTKPRVQHGVVYRDVIQVDDPFPEQAKHMKVSDYSLSVLQSLGSDPDSGVVTLQRGKIENAVNFTRSACDEDSFNSYVEDKKAYKRELDSMKKETDSNIDKND